MATDMKHSELCKAEYKDHIYRESRTKKLRRIVHDVAHDSTDYSTEHASKFHLGTVNGSFTELSTRLLFLQQQQQQQQQQQYNT